MEELEIEKRYLVPRERLADLQAKVTSDAPTHINDFYVPNGDRHKDLRLRRKGDRYMITRKCPVQDGDLTVMRETTLPISSEEFAALSCGITTNVEKNRYRINLDGWEGELDIFLGRHDGLAILEVEFPDQSALDRFVESTHWDLPDITNLEWLASGRLAETSFTDIADAIADLNVH